MYVQVHREPFTDVHLLIHVYDILYSYIPTKGYLFYIPFMHFNVRVPGSDRFYTFLQLYFESVPEVYKNK